MLKYGYALNFQRWIKENEHLLKPPVGNQQIWKDGKFIVTVVSSPNGPSDFHDDSSEEFFYQFKGSAFLLILDRGNSDAWSCAKAISPPLPPNVLHSPQRPEVGSLCLVIEHAREPGVQDAFQWNCAHCGTLIKRHEVTLQSIVDDLPPVYERFYASTEAERTCTQCGTVHPGRDYKTWHKQLETSTVLGTTEGVSA